MKKPNLLIMMTDHQRADTSFAGHICKTPHLDRFAQEGLRFNETYCPSPHCCPARATFFTGLYPSQHGIWNNICNKMAINTGLNDGVRLWSEELSEVGYQQHFIGKWHVSLEESPKDRGWIEHTATATAGAYHGWRWEQYKQLAERGESNEREEGEILRPGYGSYKLYGTSQPKNHFHDERVLRETLEALADLKNSDQPWVVYSGFIGPHDPYIVPQKYIDMYDLDEIQLPESYYDDLKDKPVLYQRMRQQTFGQLSEREIREGIRHFYAYCTYLDDCFGQILQALEETGQSEDTLVLYCSDHGDYNGEHGFFAKGIPSFSGAYHVPAVMRWPKGIKHPGRDINDFASLADFAPTFLELAGVDPKQHFAGQSLVPFLKDESPEEWRTSIFTQVNGVELYYCQRAVRTKEYHYVFNGFDQDELYDLKKDPHQIVNLANDPAYLDIKKELCGKMWKFAYEQDDGMINPYITVGLAPVGPAAAFKTFSE